MFCMETAVKLLTFSWVVYNDTTPPAKEKEVHVDLTDPKIKMPPKTVQVGQINPVHQVSALCMLFVSLIWFACFPC